MTSFAKKYLSTCTMLLVAVIVTACQQAPKQKPIANAGELPTFYSGLAAPERKLADAARQKALETLVSSKSLEWQSDGSNLTGKVSPIRTYKTTGGYFCRVFEERLIGVETWHRVRRAIACRRDGRWIVVESS